MDAKWPEQGQQYADTNVCMHMYTELFSVTVPLRLDSMVFLLSSINLQPGLFHQEVQEEGAAYPRRKPMGRRSFHVGARHER